MNIDKIKVTRYNPDISIGLNDNQIKQRYNDNLVNYDTLIKTKSISQIVIFNIINLFNILNFGLALAILFVGSYKNLFFMGVVICNTVISIIQEIHSKIVVDKLSIIAATKATVVRNGTEEKIDINKIVLDDIIKYNVGNQIIVDSIVLDGSCEVDESFITGESDPIYKVKGDILLSGSFVISGGCISRVEHIGLDNYTSSISKGAKYIKKINSVLMTSLKKVIKTVSIIIIPIGILLFNKQMSINNDLTNSIINTVAALIGMIPEGLVLLTSTVLAVSVIRLSKHKVLVQELYCIETLARVDTICFDKTGTLTDGNMYVEKVIIVQEKTTNIEEVIGALVKTLPDNNSTIMALRDKYKYEGIFTANKVIPFSSKRKWSGVNFDKKGSYIIGAPEFVLETVSEEIKEYSSNYRVLVLVHSNYTFNNNSLPKNLTLLAIILIKDNIRKDALKTLQYFKEQNVDIKIISGDSVKTVSTIAKELAFTNYDSYIDLTNLKNDEEIKACALKYNVFGRVTPDQKQTIIKALKDNGHIVAMIGDGVNDVLALKEADSSIAIASGSDAARNIAQIVLLDSNFDAMPLVVKEGRRTINNISRSATLFLAKTSYATILAILFLFINQPYPFEPIQLTLTSMVTIGIPSFILAIEPNNEKVKGNFLTNVISRALPTAFTIVTNILIIMIGIYIFNWSNEEASTLAVILTGYTGFMLLYRLSKPFNLIRKTLFIIMILSFIIGVLGFKDWFSLTNISLNMYLTVIILCINATVIFKIMTLLYYKIKAKYHKILLKEGK